MLKETETEATIGFFVTFLSLAVFQLGAGEGDLSLATPMPQTRRHGGHAGAVPPQMTGLVPPQTKVVPPNGGLCTEEFNRLGATGVQIEAQIGVFCGLTPDFMTFMG